MHAMVEAGRACAESGDEGLHRVFHDYFESLEMEREGIQDETKGKLPS